MKVCSQLFIWFVFMVRIVNKELQSLTRNLTTYRSVLDNITNLIIQLVFVKYWTLNMWV